MNTAIESSRVSRPVSWPKKCHRHSSGSLPPTQTDFPIMAIPLGVGGINVRIVRPFAVNALTTLGSYQSNAASLSSLLLSLLIQFTVIAGFFTFTVSSHQEFQGNSGMSKQDAFFCHLRTWSSQGVENSILLSTYINFRISFKLVELEQTTHTSASMKPLVGQKLWRE